MTSSSNAESRVIVVAPSNRDTPVLSKLFRQHGFAYRFCAHMQELAEQLEIGCGVAVLATTVPRTDDARPLLDFLHHQPSWSDLPLIFIARDEQINLPELAEFGNTTILRQPLHIVTLMSAIRTGLASRSKQYQLRELLVQHQRIADLLRKKDRSKDEFLATLAHEMRNPLAPLKHALELMKLMTDESSQTAELREIMSRQVNQLVRMVEDLMDVSRIRENKLTVIRTPVDLIDCLRSGIEVSRPFIDQSNQTLHVDFPSEQVVVSGDAGRLAQVTANLLNNAAKYTYDGGNIWLSCREADGHAHIEVADDGCGIESEQLDNVFSMFEQVDLQHERGPAGLGIGLALVKSLVELHQGTICVHSAGKDQGTTFALDLPICTDQVIPVAGAAQVTFDDIESLSVLVIDDAPANRLVLQRLLTAIGQQVEVASDGKQGLQVARCMRPDVVISDISMPIMNGYELARNLRADSSLSATRLIALTGNSQPAARQEAIDAGFDDFLTKPVDFQDLKLLFAKLSD